jgi:hypothetical protein
MDTFSVRAAASATLALYSSLPQPIHFLEIYGLPGLCVFSFVSRSAWQTEARILGSVDDADTMQFKGSVQDECTMLAVAVNKLVLYRQGITDA